MWLALHWTTSRCHYFFTNSLTPLDVDKPLQCHIRCTLTQSSLHVETASLVYVLKHCIFLRKNLNPQLKINRDSLEMADHTKIEESQNKSNVLCDACHENQKLSAVKSCLQCVTSFCETHLENHKTAARLIKHKLIDPVDNLEDYICEKHEKPLELFCRDDRTFLCPISLKWDTKLTTLFL